MKRFWNFLLLALLLIVLLETRALAGAPCCTIAAINPVRGVVTARDTKTGGTFQFKTEAAPLRTLKVGDPVDIDARAGRVLSVAGVSRTYAVFEPEGAEPINEVVSIEPDSADRCCAVVGARNLLTGERFQFSANRQSLTRLRVGDKIALDSTGNYAMVQSAATSGGAKATYSFPVKAIEGTGKGPTAVAKGAAAGGEDAEYWQISANPTLKGPTGRIVVDYPGTASVIFHVLGANQRQLAAWYKQGSGNFMPGTYIVKIWNAAYDGIPVRKNMDTRIKVGVLKLNIQEPYKILDPQGQVMFSGHPKEKNAIVFPVGEYTLQTKTLTERIVIKDREVTEF